MAVWISFVKASKFPAVQSEEKYKAVGSFFRAVKAEALGSAAWARRKTGFGGLNKATLEVDIEAITGVVPVLFPGGRRKS